MEKTTVFTTLLFCAAVIFALFAFYRASRNSKLVLFVLTGWLVLQSAVSATGFYLETFTRPPRFILLPVPPLLLIVVLFTTVKGRKFIDTLDLKWLTWLHVVRIPVEIVLFRLFLDGLVPEIMTFEGRNFDVLSGVSAAIVYFFAFKRNTVNRKLLLAWNLLCLVLLLNIMSTAVLSAPGPLQQMAFGQPNIGVFYFPFSLLPAFIVHVVLLAHLAALRQLLRKSRLD